jgi:uncharacterized membrane protein YadS
VVSALFKRQREAVDGGTAARRQRLVPWFLWLFVGLVLANSLGGVAPALQQGLGDLSRACLVTAIAALGMKTSFRELASAGWRPFLLLLTETLWMAGLVLVAICWL